MKKVPVGRETVHAAIGAQAESIVRRMRATGAPMDPQDVMQEAWLACLEEQARFDPRHPGAAGFFYRVAVRAVGRAIARQNCPLSLSKGLATDPRRRESAVGALVFAPVSVGAVGGNPETIVTLFQQAGHLEAARADIEACLRRAERKMDPKVRAAGRLIRAAGGGYGSAKRAAREARVSRRVFARRLVTYRRAAARAPELAKLRAQVATIEREIRS